ncbi:MAG: hypothetical protein ACXWIU_01590, partial [Limisphaerales bacterium]
ASQASSLRTLVVSNFVELPIRAYSQLIAVNRTYSRFFNLVPVRIRVRSRHSRPFTQNPLFFRK